ncbi:DUF3667 domain-containing protein [Pontibacter sp. MBLB2868]|uniref:DUF3667 domain-containing protein n=1 Tax=Pontibacter sp. MBLB2868 TaxID=3451555 RepID=UPI003F751D5B
MKKLYRSENNCLNCNATIPDKFCTSCGQENLELHENFFHLVLHSIGHYFHFESKFFKSIAPLLTKPGSLTKEYFAGKRASHLNPVSMYIFISILFFTLFTANTHINRKDILKEDTAEEITVANAETEKDKTTTGNPESKKAADLLNKDQSVKGSAGKRTDAKVPTAVEAGSENKKRPSITIGGNNIVTNTLQTKFREVLDDDVNSELFQNKLLSHLPKIMFILLPLFALILKLVNRRSRKYYTEHLIYSIHVHSFLFLFGSILIVLKWMLPFISGLIQFAGFLIVTWYIYRSMRNYYGSKRWRTVYKFLLLALSYTFLLLLSGFIVLIAILYSM